MIISFPRCDDILHHGVDVPLWEGRDRSVESVFLVPFPTRPSHSTRGSDNESTLASEVNAFDCPDVIAQAGGIEAVEVSPALGGMNHGTPEALGYHGRDLLLPGIAINVDNREVR